MLATRAEGWHDVSRAGRREKENKKNLSLSLTDCPAPSSEGGDEKPSIIESLLT